MTDKMPDEINKITTWRQGRFVDQQQYERWSAADKEQADYNEKFLVRPSPTGNAICRCTSHEDAKWLAERLNMAAEVKTLKAEHAEEIAALKAEHRKQMAVLLDGFAVYSELDDKARSRTSADNVSDVLDAVVRLINQRVSDDDV